MDQGIRALVATIQYPHDHQDTPAIRQCVLYMIASKMVPISLHADLPYSRRTAHVRIQRRSNMLGDTLNGVRNGPRQTNSARDEGVDVAIRRNVRRR